MKNSNAVNKPSRLNLVTLIILGTALCSILSGIIIIIGTYNEQTRYNNLLEGGYYTNGKVTGVTYDDEREEYYAHISYTVNEELYQFSVSKGNKYKKDSTVKVLYEAENPSNCALENDSFIDEYLSSSIFLVIGIILLPFACKGLFGIHSNHTQTAMQFNNPSDVWNYDTTNPQRNLRTYQGVNNYTQSNHAQDNYTQSNR